MSLNFPAPLDTSPDVDIINLTNFMLYQSWCGVHRKVELL